MKSQYIVPIEVKMRIAGLSPMRFYFSSIEEVGTLAGWVRR
jgi:hypothetical protein